MLAAGEGHVETVKVLLADERVDGTIVNARDKVVQRYENK